MKTTDNLNVFGVDKSRFNPNETKLGRPKKGEKIEALTPEQIKFINSIGLKVLLECDNRINDYAEKLAQKRLKSKIDTIQGKQSIAFGLLVGLVHQLVLKSTYYKQRYLLSSLTETHIHILLSAWTISQLHGPIFQSRQLLPFKSIKDSKRFNLYLNELYLIGYLEKPDDENIYSLTNKIPSKSGLRGRPRHYYKISRNGNIVINEYLEVYSKIHKKLTGKFWLSDLDKL